MFNVSEKNDYITFDISSELRLVDRVIVDAQAFLKQLGLDDASNFKLVLRELLNNAVEHGNKNDNEKRVSCKIKPLEGKRFEIEVQDAGKGFDYSKLDLNIPEDPKQIRHRGFSLINTFCDEITFNQPGNIITVYMTFVDETWFQEDQEGDFHIITPTGNLTAAIADQFRELLLGLFDRNVSYFRFNLKNVEDIDSVCLSVLILLSKSIAKKGDSFKLEIVEANKDLVKLFRLTRMDDIYSIKES